MKKGIVILLLVLGFSAAHAANAPERVSVLSAKVVLQNSNGYFALADGSCWKAVPFSKRWRTLSEWWNNVQLVPKEYECVPNDWFLGTQINIYPKYGNVAVNLDDASNIEELKQCTHLFLNTRTGQILFAIALHPADCIVQLFNDAHKDGYNKGYSDGRLKSYQNSTEVYNDGYRSGYLEGYKSALRGEELPQ